MLTGRKPFPASDLPSLFHQIQNDDPPPPSTVEAPPELAAVIMKALVEEAGDSGIRPVRSSWQIWMA